MGDDYVMFDERFKKYLCGVGANEEYLNGAWMAWQSRQAEVDQLNKVLDERTKEWLDAIKLGTYFQDAAKPLKDKVDQLQSQINEMAEVGLSQESAIREKDKRINQVSNFINNWWHPDLDQKLFVEALGKALKGNDQYTEHHIRAEQQINKGARLTKHQIDLGDNNANS